MLRALHRSTSFRLMAVVGTAFLLFLLLSGVAAFALIRAELDARMRQQLEQSFSVIGQSYGENDLTDLVDVVRGNAAANPARERIFLLQDRSGSVLAGNVTAAPDGSGWSIVDARDLGRPPLDDQYQVFAGTVGDNHLTVGASFAETKAVGGIVLNSLSLAAALFVLLLITLGVFVAARGQRRIDGIASTMAAIGKGELSARIPLRKSRDDLDDLSLQVNQALDRLVRLVDGMRQVSVDIAHDLKTPLNRLSFTVQQAIENDENGKPVGDLLQQAQDEAQQINATFEALLRITQIETGARRARFKPLSIEPVLNNIFDVYEEVAAESGHILRLDMKPVPEIVGDKDLLTQLFANLIENAIRHCPPGTEVILSASTAKDRSLQVVVADTGPGIPAAEREKVFQRLYRLDKSRTTPGNGLGLSLVKAVADLHGASIEIGDHNPGLRIGINFPAEPLAFGER